MEQDKEKSSQLRIPSDLRTYFILLGVAVVTLAVFWLAFRFMSDR
jgi:hypothetical protein